MIEKRWRKGGKEEKGSVNALTVTKKVRKVKEEILDLFPRPVFSSQIPPPPVAFAISGTVVGLPLANIWHCCGVAVSQHKLFGNESNCFRG